MCDSESIEGMSSRAERSDDSIEAESEEVYCLCKGSVIVSLMGKGIIFKGILEDHFEAIEAVRTDTIFKDWSSDDMGNASDTVTFPCSSSCSARSPDEAIKEG
mmetsp:Transcript_4337/g.4454  ORF Transcript_4337/g.4454 Transcript_4337/m.4454 type:complete len:103 (-) Transcript_4337:724-1032(-)